jgi:hypothetical protein
MQARRSTDVLRVIGFDPSLNNWGIAKGLLTPTITGGHVLTIEQLDIIQPTFSDGKQVRNNSKDLERAEQLAKGAWAAAQGADAVFVEVPHGSQSARAMASYGVCIGVLGALRTSGIPFFELSEAEVKMASLGKKGKTTKQEMIDWATQEHQEVSWPRHNGQINASKAEHMADAVAAIHAGIESKLFQQMLAILRKKPV